MDAQASLPVLIGKKRDGERLEEEEIQSFVRGVTDGTAQQGQIGGHMAGRGGKKKGGHGRGTWQGTQPRARSGSRHRDVVGNVAEAWAAQTRG